MHQYDLMYITEVREIVDVMGAVWVPKGGGEVSSADAERKMRVCWS